MYEQAFRLSYNQSIEALEKQVKCYLASLNILRLCNKEKTLVSRPKDTTEEEFSMQPTQLRSTSVRMPNIEICYDIEIIYFRIEAELHQKIK